MYMYNALDTCIGLYLFILCMIHVSTTYTEYLALVHYFSSTMVVHFLISFVLYSEPKSLGFKS